MLVDNHSKSKKVYNWIEENLTFSSSGDFSIVTGFFTIGALLYFVKITNDKIAQYQLLAGMIDAYKSGDYTNAANLYAMIDADKLIDIDGDSLEILKILYYDVVPTNFNLEFINTDDLSKENFITEGIIKYSVASKNIKNKYNLNSFKGIIVFFCYFDNEKSSAGTAECLPLDNPFLFIYKNSASESDLAHEIGHVLGLVHSFGGKEYENVKSQSENNINYYKTLFQDLKKKYKNQNLSKQKQQIDKYISDENKKISEVEELFSKNKYEFSEGQTTNIMDYQEDRKEQKDFFHWQWLVMREEVKKYYS